MTQTSTDYIKICTADYCGNGNLHKDVENALATTIPIHPVNCLGGCSYKQRVDITSQGQLTKYAGSEYVCNDKIIIKALGIDPLSTILEAIPKKIPKTNHATMKIGIIHSLKEDSPLTKVYEMLCKDIAKLETVLYASDTFTPDHIKQDSVDCLLFYSTNESDDGLAKAIHKHSKVPLLYHLTPDGCTNTPKRYDQLNESGIEVYLFLPKENYRTTQDLLERLKQLGEQQP